MHVIAYAAHDCSVIKMCDVLNQPVFRSVPSSMAAAAPAAAEKPIQAFAAHECGVSRPYCFFVVAVPLGLC
jgi:hypothetical protein